MNPTKDRTSLLVDVAKKLIGKGMTQKEIAASLNKTESYISKLVDQAKKAGIIVQTVADPSNKRSTERNTDLERRLKKSFPSLNHAIVISCEGLRKIKRWDVLDDEKHRLLGRAIAPHLVQALRDNDRVGIGGGRGCYFVAEALKNLDPPPPQRNIKIISLHGSTDTRLWTAGSENNIPIDSDTVAVEFAKAFPGAEIFKVALPLAMPEKIKKMVLGEVEGEQGVTINIQKALWRNDYNDKRNKYLPTIAVVGVGVVAEARHEVRHRLFLKKHDRDNETIDDPYPCETFKSAIKKMEEPIHQIKQQLDTFIVGDMSNRLFLVDFDKEVEDRYAKLREERNESQTHFIKFKSIVLNIKEIADSIEEANKYLIAVDFEQLSWIHNVNVVAGGVNKASALFHVLTNEEFQFVRMLVTDEDTADILLKKKVAPSVYDSRDRKLKMIDKIREDLETLKKEEVERGFVKPRPKRIQGEKNRRPNL